MNQQTLPTKLNNTCSNSDNLKFPSDLVIDESNFNQYFFDIRKHRPKPGQVLACYETEADLVNGQLKYDIINLLRTSENGSESAIRCMQKLAGATQESSLRVVKDITKDLLQGVSEADVLEKPYPFHLKMFYYTYKELIPSNDPHWWDISLVESVTNTESLEASVD